MDVPAEAKKAKEPEAPDTVEFKFTHRLFSIPGCVFRKTPEGDQVALYVPMGDMRAVLLVHHIHREFDIPEDSEDRNLMSLAAQALQYVKQVYPGDSIPMDVLTGNAPWLVEERFLELAKAWVTMLVVAWKTGEDISEMKHKDMLVGAATPQSREIFENAPAAIAHEIDPENPNPDQVKELLEKLAQELSYIEALREKLLDIRRLQLKLKNLYATCQTDKGMAEQIMRCDSLFAPPVKELFGKFARLDREVSGIVDILRHFHNHVEFIRAQRDALRAVVEMWEPLIQQWDRFNGKRGEAAELLIRDTYRFAARHYTQSVAW